ncbi:MAG TPA: GGDEF domain-containing protein [Burkholderiaceae bacterium]|nr:GGDEF domain-containing protein [Burkholderiaceae bacterium]
MSALARDAILSGARLNGGRDRDLLELEVLDVLSAVLRLRSIELHRIETDGGVRRSWRRARLAEGEPTVTYERPLNEQLQPVAWDFGQPALTVPGKRADDGLWSCIIALGDPREPMGWITLASSREPGADELRVVGALLGIYANHLALLDYSERDTLTGLMNRKTFDDSFLRMLSDPRMQGERPSYDRRQDAAPADHWLAVVDIDRFKSVNDTFGHLYGDEVLVLVAGLMRRSFRHADRLYRFGGEEFAILLDRTPDPYVCAVLDKFRVRVADHRFPQIGTVTVSVGYTRLTAGDSPSSAFDRADAALYFAKHNGRNQVCGWERLNERGLLVQRRSNQDVELF